MDIKRRKVKPGREARLVFFFFQRQGCMLCGTQKHGSVSAFAITSPRPVPSSTPRNSYPLLSSPANSCGWKIPQHLQLMHWRTGHAPRACTETLPETERGERLPVAQPRPGETFLTSKLPQPTLKQAETQPLPDGLLCLAGRRPGQIYSLALSL